VRESALDRGESHPARKDADGMGQPPTATGNLHIPKPEKYGLLSVRFAFRQGGNLVS